MGDFDDFDFEDLGVSGERDDAIPCRGSHRGIGLHAGQSAKRLKVMRRDIDRVYALGEDVDGLFEFAGAVMRSPESRLFAAAKCEALWNDATERRRERPNFDRARLEVMICGLDSKVWRDPDYFGTLLDVRTRLHGILRERALTEDE